ncbi:MAG: zinc-ribbon domain containing protein [Candidatus Thermoplasmatota archaeon]|nr:zinc-ribbon domain containing protein [Candidatus Thermoplasmatota archaeon]
MQDITLECMLCGAPFVFTGGEQKWYQKRGLNQPKRCEKCREENKGYETD